MSGAGYTEGIDVRAITFERVANAAESDDECQTLIKTIINGFPDAKENLPLMLNY